MHFLAFFCERSGVLLCFCDTRSVVSMPFCVANVIALLRKRFGDGGDPEASSREEKKLADRFVTILNLHVDDYTELEIEDEEHQEVCHFL